MLNTPAVQLSTTVCVNCGATPMIAIYPLFTGEVRGGYKLIRGQCRDCGDQVCFMSGDNYPTSYETSTTVVVKKKKKVKDIDLADEDINSFSSVLKEFSDSLKKPSLVVGRISPKKSSEPNRSASSKPLLALPVKVKKEKKVVVTSIKVSSDIVYEGVAISAKAGKVYGMMLYLINSSEFYPLQDLGMSINLPKLDEKMASGMLDRVGMSGKYTIFGGAISLGVQVPLKKKVKK